MKIGIDIGGSHIASGIVEEDGTLIGKETLDIDLSEISEAEIKSLILSSINNEINILLQKYNYKKEDIYQIGIAAPGSPSESSLQNLVNLHIKEFNIKDEISKNFSCPIKLKNDGKCAGLAEKKYGSLKDYNDAVFLCLGTGVGSAVFLGGKLLEPKQSSGFEFGHMVIEKDNGETCNCGNKGCFETFASMKRFKKRAIKEFNLPFDIKSEELQHFIRSYLKEAQKHEERIEFLNNEYLNTNENTKIEQSLQVKKFVDNYIENVAIGISNIINIFEPEAICFGGSFSYYDDIFLPLLEKKVEVHKFNKQTHTKFVFSKLKNDAGIIGAAEL
jgi:glucokinase